MSQDDITYFFYMMMLVIFALFFIIEAYMDSSRPKFGHSTGIIIIIGIIISCIIYELSLSDEDSKFVLDDLMFNQDIFFDLILPLIVFPLGYNMRRKRFFSNIGTIMKFGFIGTIFCFIVYSGMTYIALKHGWLRKWDSASN